MNKANAYLLERIGKDALVIAELLQTLEQRDAEIAALKQQLEAKPDGANQNGG